MSQRFESFVNDPSSYGNEINRKFNFLEEVFLHEDMEALEAYLEAGYDINTRNEYLATAAFTLSKKSVEFVEYLVEKGLNLHILSIQGDNLLVRIAAYASEELMTYIASKGVNPYEVNLEGNDLYSYIGHNSLQRDLEIRNIIDHSLYEKDVDDFHDAVARKDYPTALKIANSKAERMGGLKAILDSANSDSKFVHYVIRMLHDAMLINGLVDQANNLITVYVDHVVPKAPTPNGTCIGLLATYLQKDVRNMSILIRENSYNAGTVADIELQDFFAYALLSRIAPKDYPLLKNLKRKALKAARTSHFLTKYMFQVLIEECEKEMSAEEIEETLQLLRPANKVTYGFGLAVMYYAKGDLLNATYMLNYVLKTSDEHQLVFTTYVSQAVMLLNLIQNQVEA